jgi:RNA polymerase sigma factor (sigma-70 family)
VAGLVSVAPRRSPHRVSKEASLSRPGAYPVPLSEEQAVIHRLQRGDRQALAMLFGWYGDRIFRYDILPCLPAPEQAEDILKETFRIAMERIDQFQPQTVSIYRWLRRIALNLVLDAGRKTTRRIRFEKALELEIDHAMGAPPPSPEATVERHELRELIEQSLSTLSSRHAQVLRLRLLEERSRQECAEKMGLSVPALDMLLHRACIAFREAYPP